MMDKTWVFNTKNGKCGLFRQVDRRILLHIEDGFPSNGFEMEFGDLKGIIDNEPFENISMMCNTLNIYLRDKNIFEEVCQIDECHYPGHYYPRIVRKNINFNYINNDFLQDSRAYQNIQSSLDELFNYIEPSEINFLSHGHKIRELLIIACTEVEYLLQKMLVENGYTEKEMYTTRDYIKCKDILKLDSFAVQLNQYPTLGVFKPFFQWDSSSPTRSLSWYKAYNAVKHNRGDNIAQANMKNLLNAVSAIHILLESQYGLNIFKKFESYTEDRSMLHTIKAPTWELKEIVVPVLERAYGVKVNWIGPRKYFEDFPELLK